MEEPLARFPAQRDGKGQTAVTSVVVKTEALHLGPRQLLAHANGSGARRAPQQWGATDQAHAQQPKARAGHRVTLGGSLGERLTVQGERNEPIRLEGESRHTCRTQLRQDAEGARVSVRNVRRDVLSDVKEALKEKLISQDDERKAQEEIQKLTDRFVAEIEQHLSVKEKEILQV